MTPNPDLDITFWRTGRQHEQEVDVAPLAETAGGKGNNAARVLAMLGHRCIALGLFGGWTGARIEELLVAAGVACAATPIRNHNRVYVTVADSSGRRLVSYHAPGPEVTVPEIQRLVDDVTRVARPVRRVVIAGALPPGVGPEWYARLVDAAGPDNVVVDAAENNLSAALVAGARRVKVNRVEFEGLVGGAPLRTVAAVAKAATSVGERYHLSLLCVTLGRHGAVAWSEGIAVRVQGIPVVARSTLAAGDAFLAGLLHGEALGSGLADSLRWAVACSSSMCEQAAPEEINVPRVSWLATQAKVSTLH